MDNRTILLNHLNDLEIGIKHLIYNQKQVCFNSDFSIEDIKQSTKFQILLEVQTFYERCNKISEEINEKS